MESQDGNVYLDGVNGTMRLKGTIQHSTATSGNFSDADIFKLPAKTSLYTFSMGEEDEDIGKRVILTNSSARGSNGVYRIACRKWGKNGSTTYMGNYEYYAIFPGETIEMTCFALASGDTVEISGTSYTVTSGGWWKVTKRFNGDMPRVVAMGTVSGYSSGASVYGKTVAGDTLSVSRTGVGQYTVELPSYFSNASTLLVLATGIGYVSGSSTAPTKATFLSKSGRNLYFMVSDDDTANDGSFSFVCIDYGGWSLS